MKFVGAYAQGTELKSFTFYSQKDGLSNYNIHKIIQDDKNYLWIATQDGLNRFDGHTFIVYNKGLERKRTLLSNDIRDLLYDTAHQTIWVICNQGGINGIDVLTGDVIFSVLYNNDVLETDWRTCAVMVNNTIFIGSSGGVEVFDMVTHNFRHSSIQHASFPSGFASIDVHTMAVDEYKNIWITARDKGIIIYNPASDSVLRVVPSIVLQPANTDHSFWPLCQVFTTGDTCWIGSTNKLLALHFDSVYHIHPIFLQNNSLTPVAGQTISDLAFNNDGQLLLSGNTLYQYNLARHKLLILLPADKENSKWITDITCCYEDTQKNLWLGCKQGLGLMKNNRVAFLPTHNGKTFNDALSHVYSVCVLDSNTLFAGTKDGLYLVDNQKQASRQLLSGLVQNIIRLKNNEIIVSGDKGLWLWRNQKMIAIGKVYPEFIDYPDVQLNSCAVFNDSILILGTESYDGILLWNTKSHKLTNIKHNDENGLMSDIVNTVFVNKDKQAMVLSDYGITVINGESYSTQKLVWKNQTTHTPMGIFMDMTETSNYYWINTYSEGLVMMDKTFRIIKTFGIKDGLSNTGLYKIFNYKDSLLFLTSNNGISVFDVKTKTCRRYYEEDGLQNNTFEEACGDVWGNNFYAGGVEGFVTIHPSDIRPDTAVPQLYFTRLKIQEDNQQVIDTFNLNLQHFSIPSNAVQTNIYFSGLNYSNPKRVQYAYRIKEKESDWINLNGDDFISLIGFPKGNYTLQVKAANGDGLWSSIKEIDLTFLPKWYETIWFDMALGGSIALILYAFYLYRIGQIKQQQLIRKNIASDLHDDLGSTLNTVKVFTHLAKRGDPQQYLDQIEISVTEATLGMRDMIWVLDDSEDTVQAILARIEKIVKPVADANNIRFECCNELGDKDQRVAKTEKKNLLLIIKESINNSIKYADCRHIHVIFKRENNMRILEISDDGKGFEPETVAKGNGLNNLQRRAEQIHYKLSVISLSGKGTTVRVEGKG